jgi:transcription antitermination factor NusG
MRQSLPLMHFYSGKLLQFYSGVDIARQGVKRGDRIRILRGPFSGHLAIYSDSKPRDRIEVLLSTQRATLASLDVEFVKR